MSTHSAAPARDNLLGICHAIGEDFGFNPIFLRIPLAVALIADARWTLIAYAAMGLAVLASRLLVRAPKAVATIMPSADPVPQETAPVEALALAA